MSHTCVWGRSQARLPDSVLIVGVTSSISDELSLGLQGQGYSVTHERPGVDALKVIDDHSWGLLIVDAALEYDEGYATCRSLRARCNQTPIIMVATNATEQERVCALESGADQILDRSISARELNAHIRSIQRRVLATTHTQLSMGATHDTGLTIVGDIEIDQQTLVATLDGRRLDLTPKEFDLLYLLAETPGKVFKRRELLARIWGQDAQAKGHTINSHINRLRAKIERDPSSPRRIVTVWGVGYTLRKTATE